MENQFVEELSFTEATDVNGGSIVDGLIKLLIEYINRDVVSI